MARQSFASSFKPGDCPNLAELENLNEQTLLEELNIRYKRDDIYTYVGEILVAVNPYKQIPGIYDAAKQVIYGNGVDKKSVPPHIFAVSDNAFEAMKTTRKDQVCVISGESGAGKTESAKLFLKQIIKLSAGSESEGLAERIINVNPLLEAFGNAQTNMNDNSSRFGKYLDLRFNDQLAVKGAIITEYLLEKSRVVHQGVGERNFHIFYYIFAGLDSAQRDALEIKDPSQHRIINGNDEALASIDSSSMKSAWDEVVTCMSAVGFTKEQENDLFSLLSGILWLADVEFEGEESASVSSSSEILNTACSLLGVEATTMELALTTLVTITRGEEVIREYKVEQADDCRDAACKAIYGKAFSWIIRCVNKLLVGKAKLSMKDLKISFLDIFGFENFDENSFEQLCINLANEQLQFFFNNHIFAMELAEYAKEGIDGSKITYESNQPVLDMILQRKPPGLLMMLDEETSFPRATDSTMLEKFHDAFGKLKDYDAPRGNEAYFGVCHYAGKVRYESYGFLEKNRDTLAADIMAAMRLSENNLVRELFNADLEDAKAAKGKAARKGKLHRGDRGASRKNLRMSMKKVQQSLARKQKKTVSSSFKESLELLMKSLNAAEPHFIRCIKPNSNKAALDYDGELVTKQLRYTGMLETTRIRREGYAMRPTFGDFIERYKALGFYLSANVPASSAACSKILEKSAIQGWLLGKTKVFLKYYHVDELNDKLRPMGGAARVLQKVFRGGAARAAHQKLVEQKRQTMKAVSDFISIAERQIQGFCDVIFALIEEDNKRPADFWTKPAPALAERKYKKKMSSRGGGGGLKRAASVKWFKEVEMAKGSALADDSNEGGGVGAFAAWFHGIITRAESERLLGPHSQGTFLIRVSESRFGYSLSFKHNNRIKHFMIDQTPEGRYLVVGNDRTFGSLNELVSFHRSHTLTDDGDTLVTPCPQDEDNLQEFM